MKHLPFVICAALVLTGCQQDRTPVATTETSLGGIAYTRLYLPEADTVAVQIAWPTDWALRDDVNQAVPYIGTDLILAGGAEGLPPGEVTETFADLRAEGALTPMVDDVLGHLIVPKENLGKAAQIAGAHLATPTLDAAWFERIRQGLAENMVEANAQPAARGYAALRWAILGDTPLRRALSLDDPTMITAATRDEVVTWHRQTIVRNRAKVVIAGAISEQEAGHTVDTLLSRLPEGAPLTPPTPSANFAPRRILLHVPEATPSTLVFIGPLPPTREGGEFEDVLLATALGGGDQSVLFDAVRTGLRASYGFGAGLDGYARDLRVLVLSGEVDTAKLAEAEDIVRKAYAGFMAAPDAGDLAARKAPFKANAEQGATDPASAAFSALMAVLDGQDPAVALTLSALLDKVTETTISARAASAFPKPEGLTVLAVSPDANALGGACVITSPAEAVNCR